MSTERTFPTSLDVTVTIRAASPSSLPPVVVRSTVDGPALMASAYDGPVPVGTDRPHRMRQSMMRLIGMAVQQTIRDAAWRMLSGMLGLDPEEK